MTPPATRPVHPPLAERGRTVAGELAFAVVGMFVGVMVLFVLRAVGLWPSGEGAPRGLSLVNGPLITGMAALAYRFAAARVLADTPELVAAPLREGPARAIATAVLGIVAAIAGSVVLGGVLELLGAPVAEQGGIVEIVQDWRNGTDRSTVYVLGVSAVVLAPVCEEALFRGLLFARLRRATGRALGYGVSALAFAAIHANPAGFVIYVWLGLVFAWSLERSGRLWPAIAVHMGNNAFAFAALLLGETATVP
ncbi:MAG: CPBP family intramembrane metalloprotease [Nannocystaceae bacterium]|nr:CPBP family intramembrane metalloprotease [Nannocystaceae bacterium]